MAGYKYTIKKFLRDWMLILGIAAGVGLYILYANLPFLHPAGPFLKGFCTRIQPTLLFAMLFLSFCKIEPRDIRPRRWHLWLLLVQGSLFIAIAMILATHPAIPFRLGIEALMLCLICPTATACAVVTGKLGGDMAGAVTYTIFINLLVAVLVPLFVPLIHPMEGLTFFSAFLKILGKVFPLLIMPCLLAWAVRYFAPRLHKWLLGFTDLAFYIWAVSLTLAILMSTRAIFHSTEGAAVLLDIAVASLIACIFQFWAGKRLGAPYGQKITAGQSLGQKNTVFGIWMAYTFLDPVTSVAGGFYSLWHNVYNTWQLYQTRKKKEKSAGR